LVVGIWNLPLGLYFGFVSNVSLFLRTDYNLLVDEHVPDRVRRLSAFGNPVLDAVGVQFVSLFLAAAINSAEVFEVSTPRIAAFFDDNKAERRFLGFSNARKTNAKHSVLCA